MLMTVVSLLLLYLPNHYILLLIIKLRVFLQANLLLENLLWLWVVFSV